MFDSDGKIEIDPKVAKQYPGLVTYAKNLASTYANKPQAFRDKFKQYSGMTNKEIKDFVTYNKGPRVTIAELDKDANHRTNGVTILYPENGNLVNSDENGKYVKGGGRGLIKIDNDVVSMYEGAKTMGDKQAAEVLLESTLFHEGVHKGTGTRKSNENEYDNNGKEKGKEFEKSYYGVDVGRDNAQRIGNPELKAVAIKPNFN